MGMESEKIKSVTASSRLQGHLAMFAAAVLWGAMSPIAKHVMLSGALQPLALSAIRIVGGALVFWIAGSFLPERIAGRGRISPRHIPVLILMAVLIVAANQGLYIVGIGFTTPFEATVMTTMTPVFTMLIAAVFLSMPMTVMRVAGVVLGLGGALLLALSGREAGDSVAGDPMLGNLMCLGAQLCAAVYFTMFRKIIDSYHPFVLLKWLFTIGAVLWVPLTWSSIADIRFDLLDWSVVGCVIFIILFPTFLSYLFMVFAQQRIRPMSVSMYSYIQPLTAAALASLMGLAAFGWANIIASLMIFAGVAFVALAPGAQLQKAR